MIYLFDIDGTLLLSGGAGSRALDRSFVDNHAVSGAMAGIDPAGKTDPRIVEEAFRARLGRQPTQVEVDRILERYLIHLAQEVATASEYRVMPGVTEVLPRLHTAGHALGLATGNIRQGALVKLQRADLARWFAFGGYGSDSADRATLVGMAACRGAARLKQTLSPASVIVVGDTPRDVAAARAHGFGAVVLVSGTVPLGDLQACEPDRIVLSLSEL